MNLSPSKSRRSCQKHTRKARKCDGRPGFRHVSVVALHPARHVLCSTALRHLVILRLLHRATSLFIAPHALQRGLHRLAILRWRTHDNIVLCRVRRLLQSLLRRCMNRMCFVCRRDRGFQWTEVPVSEPHRTSVKQQRVRRSTGCKARPAAAQPPSRCPFTGRAASPAMR